MVQNRFICHMLRRLHVFTIQRFYCSSVRVRFAPSPTGNLHLGGLRTAFYNFLYARKNGGKFILRIEDTDQKRIKAGSTDSLQQVLIWAGIAPDESPTSGGHYGPYIQSQRLDRYRQRADELLESGEAYRCFCSSMRLDIIRKEALKQRQNPGYDNKCRHLTPSEIQDQLEKKQPFVIRYKLKDGPISFNDTVFGTQTVDISGNEGDFVILKSDGYPTYHFACVVDDHDMQISHVLRGAEWLVSTPKHIMLHSAFGWQPPIFAHLPLLVNKNRTKLSKRQEALGVQYLKEKGYEPLALLNFLSGLGSGFGDLDYNIFELEELHLKFELSEVSRNSCFLDIEKLDFYNKKYLTKQLSKEITTDEVTSTFRSILKNTLGERYELSENQMNDEFIKKILHCYKDRISNLMELVEPEMQFLWAMPEVSDVTSNLQELAIDSWDAAEAAEYTLEALSKMQEEQFERESLSKVLKECSKNSKLKLPQFMQSLRILLTGMKVGPGVWEIFCMLGKERSLRKLSVIKKSLTSSLSLKQQSN